MAVEYDLVVIGGGSGGLVVAGVAAALNAKVALIEKHRLGGDCLWYGCVPSKSLIHASRLAYQVKNAGKFGIYSQDVSIDFAKAIAHVQNVITTSEPSREKACPNSQPIGPPPITARVSGRSLMEKTSSLVIYPTSSSPEIFGMAGFEPVEITKALALTLLPLILKVRRSINSPSPKITSQPKPSKRLGESWGSIAEITFCTWAIALAKSIDTS